VTLKPLKKQGSLMITMSDMNSSESDPGVDTRRQAKVRDDFVDFFTSLIRRRTAWQPKSCWKLNVLTYRQHSHHYIILHRPHTHAAV